MKKVVFCSQGGKLTWEPSRGTEAQIKHGPFEESSVAAAVLDTFSRFMNSVVVTMNTVATSGVPGPDQLRELLRQQGEAVEKVVADHMGTSKP